MANYADKTIGAIGGGVWGLVKGVGKVITSPFFYLFYAARIVASTPYLFYKRFRTQGSNPILALVLAFLSQIAFSVILVLYTAMIIRESILYSLLIVPYLEFKKGWKLGLTGLLSAMSDDIMSIPTLFEDSALYNKLFLKVYKFVEFYCKYSASDQETLSSQRERTQIFVEVYEVINDLNRRSPGDSPFKTEQVLEQLRTIDTAALSALMDHALENDLNRDTYVDIPISETKSELNRATRILNTYQQESNDYLSDFVATTTPDARQQLQTNIINLRRPIRELREGIEQLAGAFQTVKTIQEKISQNTLAPDANTQRQRTAAIRILTTTKNQLHEIRNRISMRYPLNQFRGVPRDLGSINFNNLTTDILQLMRTGPSHPIQERMSPTEFANFGLTTTIQILSKEELSFYKQHQHQAVLPLIERYESIQNELKAIENEPCVMQLNVPEPKDKIVLVKQYCIASMLGTREQWRAIPNSSIANSSIICDRESLKSLCCDTHVGQTQLKNPLTRDPLLHPAKYNLNNTEYKTRYRYHDFYVNAGDIETGDSEIFSPELAEIAAELRTISPMTSAANSSSYVAMSIAGLGLTPNKTQTNTTAPLSTNEATRNAWSNKYPTSQAATNDTQVVHNAENSSQAQPESTTPAFASS
ncbi:MAG: hypothetical protein Q8R83_07595 [Legionellaceae bacterium]|nr:hypothetical protein [Legionellaceae bacterium]